MGYRRKYKNTNRASRYKYPYKIQCDDGLIIPVPKQQHFKSTFIRKHGCPLVGMYIGLRWCGKKWSMKKVKKYSEGHFRKHATYRLYDIAKGMRKICPGAKIVYKAQMSEAGMRKCLKKGYCLIFCEKNPTHVVVLLWNGHRGVCKRVSSGRITDVSLKKEAARRCKDRFYRGVIVIRKVH